MPDVSMARLREMGQTCDDCTSALCPYVDGKSSCMPNSAEAESMAAELIRLREMIGDPNNFSAGSHNTGRVCVWLSFDTYSGCRRALLEEAPK